MVVGLRSPCPGTLAASQLLRAALQALPGVLFTFEVNDDAPNLCCVSNISDFSFCRQLGVSDHVGPTWVLPLSEGQLIRNLSDSSPLTAGVIAHHRQGKDLQESGSHLGVLPTTVGTVGPWVHTSALSAGGHPLTPSSQEGSRETAHQPESTDVPPSEPLLSALGQQALFSSQPLPPL